MEDGDISHTEVLSTLNAEEKEDGLSGMANYPDLEVAVIKSKSTADSSTEAGAKVNGESDNKDGVQNEEEEDSTDEDALVIDEERKSQKKVSAAANRKRLLSPSSRSDFKGFKKRMLRQSTEVLKIVNEYINAAQLDENNKITSEEKCDIVDDSNSQGEFDNIVLQEAITKNIKDDTEIPKREDNDIDNNDNDKAKDNETPTSNDHKSNLVQIPVDAIVEESTQKPLCPKPRNITVHKLKTSGKKTNKKTPSPKLTEYAQYLGLQPTVKFKCYKCSESSFPSMSALNEHQQQCLVQPPTSKPNPPPPPNPAATTPSTNFRVTRKVYLCSACGTYYENWNLFLHMREVHRRFICLYCLGMFSFVEKLSQHLVSKHNCVPSHYLSAEDYLSTCKEACFLMCCHCEKVFTEQDNFFDHICSERATTSSDKACWSCGVKGTNPHLPLCKASIEQPSTSNQKTNKVSTQKSINSKQNKSTKKTFANVEHVTADSPSKPISPRLEPEQTCDIANLCTVDMEPTTIKSEPMSPEKSPRERSPSFSEDHREETEPESTEDPESGNRDYGNDNGNQTEHEKPGSPERDEPADNESENEIANENEQECDKVVSDNEMPANDSQEENNKNNDTEPEQESEPEPEPEPERDDKSDVEADAETETEADVEAEPERETETEADVDQDVDVDANPNPNPDPEPDPDPNPDPDIDAEGEADTEEEKMDHDNYDSPLENGNDSDNDIDSDNAMETELNTETNELDTTNENDDQHSVELPVNINDSDRNNSFSEAEMEVENAKTETTTEVRRVPKVTLKLPPPGTRYSDNESDDSEKLTMEVEENEDSEQEYEESHENSSKEYNDTDKPVNGFEENDKDGMCDRNDGESFPIAGDDINIIELELEQPLDKFTMENLLKTCLGATISTCIYCNHARKIAVNGKQLGLHAIAEHRFAATVNSITAEELIPHNFVVRIKDGLSELEETYFNLEKIKVEDEKDVQPNEIIFKREYECFQCRYVTAIHKELYLHNRKMHAKTILLCIICKSNFYSYSELICHLCPGNYDLHNEMKFRCCMCDTGDLPSAFRLMVHLRKKHHTCDVCLEGCTNQARLSNHVWKHKLHHLCYRCGIAYRNKPDITKHLFWKHGTESVLCKKCLQKKWPHVYHFCIPPTAFVCEECNLSFSRAVYLKVHKRLHSSEKKHSCTEDNCTERFISKKLLLKHEKRHREPDPVPEEPPEIINGDLKSEIDITKPESLDKEILSENKEVTDENKPPEKEEQKPKNIIDVYDLPALNLSESDSDESEDETPKPVAPTPLEEAVTKIDENVPAEPTTVTDALQTETNTETTEEEQKPVPIVDGIWDNFKQYQATIEKRESISTDNKDEQVDEKIEEKTENMQVEKSESMEVDPEKEQQNENSLEEDIKPDINVIMADHDYCVVSTETKENREKDDKQMVKKDENSEMDHDYCTLSKTDGIKQHNSTENRPGEDTDRKKNKAMKKKNSSSSDSSSDSDSSSCTCGSNCSCSSSSGSSSSSSSSSDSDSSSSEGKRRIAERRERRKVRAKKKKESETSQAASNTSAVDVVATEENNPLPPIIELPIEESDLDTDETETDEDFYDEHPQRLANKILEEKRNQLMLLAGVTPPVSNGSIVQSSRPSTPSIPEEVPTKKKVKSKKRKKKSRSSTPKQEMPHNIPNYHNHHQQSPLAIQTPITPIPTIVHRPALPSPIHHHPVSVPPVVPRLVLETPKQQSQTTGSGSETDSNVRSSKRRRVPNKFYGYSSDDENADKPPPPPILKWRKADLPSTPTHHITASPKFVPPITIKNIPSPAPIIEPIQAPVVHHAEVPDSDSEVEEVQAVKSSSESSDSNRNEDSDSDEGQLHISQAQFPPMAVPQVQRTNENLYCYCQCPYDEVSEMIACDGRECAIEWFHFECVGIMVPPKGKWFCPDCRKKSTLRNDFIQT